MMTFTITTCETAQEHHKRSIRQYAHVLHRKGRICIAAPFWQLPTPHLLGILAHEVGHILADQAGLESTEAEADAEARKLGINIAYKDGPHGERLQWLSPSARDRFHDVFFLSRNHLSLR